MTRITDIGGQVLGPDGKPAIFKAIEANWYEGSRWSPHRSFVWFPVQDAKRDLDRFTRYELSKHARYLVKNSPFIRGLIERLVNLTIGTGIHPVPISSDKAWNQKAKASWRMFCRRPCVDSLMSMGLYQRILARSRFVDGEAFTILTYDKDDWAAKIQGIESHRVTSQGTEGDKDHTDDNWQTVNQKNADGIRLNQQGKPVSYKLRGVERPYPAGLIVHHYTPIRFDQPRGETVLASSINTARDVDDILSLEKQAVKDASSHKDIIKTASGELDPETLRSLKFNQQYPTPLSLPSDDKTRTDYYRVHFGAEPVVLRRGDEYTPYKPDRPGAAWQGFMDFLSNTICLSTGLPPSVLLPVSLGGTDVRRDLELAQRIIEPWQWDLAAEMQRIWEYWAECSMDEGTLSSAPDDWRCVRWHFPKSISVDRGRDAVADRADVQCGLMSHEEYHGRYGDDGDEYEETIVFELKRRRFRLFGTPESEPFRDMAEVMQLMSLDSKTLVGVTPPAADDASQEPQDDDEPALNVPAKRKQPLKTND